MVSHEGITNGYPYPPDLLSPRAEKGGAAESVGQVVKCPTNLTPSVP